MSLRFAFGLLAGVLGAPLSAQQPAIPDSVAAPLPPVTITASRVASSLLTAPLAITRIGTSELRVTRGIGLDDALSLVPGVLAQSRYGTSDVRIVIRGFGARGAGDRSNAGTSRGIRVLIDGIPETEPDGRTSFDQVDLGATETVEVVRSNASSIWGNAAGGVVSVATMPAVSEPRLEVQPVFGSFGLRRWVTRAATPLGGSGTVWGSFTNTSLEGWRAHSSSRRVLVTLGVKGTVGEKTRVGAYASGANNLFRIPGPLTMTEAESDPTQANAVYAARDERRHNRVARLGVSLEHAADSLSSIAVTLFASPKVLQRSERGTFRDFNRYHVGGSLVARRTMALSARVGGALVLGVDEAYQDGAILFYSLTPEGRRGTILRENQGEGANNFGVFAHQELQLGRRVDITLGARWDAVRYDYRSYLSPHLDDARSFSRLTPKLAMSVQLGDRHAAYANVGGGIEVPAGNETDPAGTFGQDTISGINPLLDAIRSTTVEAGFRSLPAQDAPLSLGYDLALYSTDVRNELVPYQGGRFYFPAGRARRRGAELGLDARTSAGVSVRTALTISRNLYLQYVVDSVHYGRPGSIADYADNDVVGVPSRMVNAEVSAELPWWRALRLRAAVEHVGAYYVDDANTVRVPAYTTLSATAELVGWMPRGGAWGARGFVSVANLTDRRYVGSAFLNPDRIAGVPVAFEPGMPRSVVVSLTVGRLR